MDMGYIQKLVDEAFGKEYLEDTISALGAAWKKLLNSKDKEEFDYWEEVIKEQQQKLYKKKRVIYLHFYNCCDESRERKRKRYREKHPNCGKPGRKRKYKTEEERKKATKEYQHNYYLNVLKDKRRIK